MSEYDLNTVRIVAYTMFFFGEVLGLLISALFC